MQLIHTLAHLFHPRRSNNHRPALLHPQWLFTLAAIAVVFTLILRASVIIPGQLGDVLGYASNVTAADIVVRTNQKRLEAGVPELITNPRLNQAALAKAAHMFEKQYWAHVSPDGVQPWAFFKQSNYSYRVAGENLARDFSNADDMMSAWMASPTHRANIVNGKYQEIGVAVVDGTLLGTETTLVVQLFGAPLEPGQLAQVSDQPKPTAAPKVVATPAPAQPEVSPVPVPVEPVDTIGFAEPASPGTQILGSGFFRLETLKAPPLFSPLQLSKLFFLAIIFMIISTLFYDAAIMGHRNTVRLVGKNFAHILLFMVIAYLLIFFKAGVVG